MNPGMGSVFICIFSQLIFSTHEQYWFYQHLSSPEIQDGREILLQAQDFVL